MYVACASAISDPTDNTKQVGLTISTLPTGVKTTLQFNQTTNRTITFSDASADSFVVQDTSGALVITNAASTGNTLTATGQIQHLGKP